VNSQKRRIREYDTEQSDEHLHWRSGSARRVFQGPIFDVQAVEHHREDGRTGEFLRLDCADWVNVSAFHRDSRGRLCLVMVRQFRQGAGEMSLELPGGMVDPGEDAAEAAKRELLEETGFQTLQVEHLGSASPNAAFMGNRMHCYVALDCEYLGEQDLDENEVIDVELVPIELVEQGRVPEFLVNGIMAVPWYYLSVWIKNGGLETMGENI
jgi:ADP-ribose pyrophosphatase